MARRIARQLFPSAYSTEVDPAALMAARESIAVRILELTGKSLPPEFGTVGGAGGGCGSTGGMGGALLALPGLRGLAPRRRRRSAAAASPGVR
jgi:hypothetical protein